jgi:hypothetical protein
LTAPDPAPTGAGGNGTPPTGPAGPAWLRTLGPRAVRRPPVSLGGAAAGVGGALVAVGTIVLAGDSWTSSGSSAQAVLVTGALLVSTAAAISRAEGPARAAAVAASGLAAPAVAFFANAGDGFPSLRATAVVAALLLAALYLVGPWRGHTFHLAVLVGAGWLFALSVGDAALGGSFFGGFGTVADAVADAGVASMATGVLYLLAGGWLHAGGLEGMATPFLAVGAVALPLGTVTAVESDGAAGVFLVVVGATMAVLGAWCRRRGTTWAGAAVCGVGVGAVALAVGSDGVTVPALVAVGAGVALVALSPAAATLVDEGAGTADPEDR